MAATKAAVLRELDELERRADERDRKADERDRVADARERAADEVEAQLGADPAAARDAVMRQAAPEPPATDQ